jgi:hypothetical protein
MLKGRGCKLTANYFYYVCGFYIRPKQVKHNIVPGMKFCTVYRAYFRVPVGEQDEFWAPHVCCGSCQSLLEGWLCGTRKCMPFAIPQICVWGSRATGQHYIQKVWPERGQLIPGMHNVIHKASVSREKIWCYPSTLNWDY